MTFDRRRRIERTRLLLERLHSPRFHMSVIVALTALVGLLSSFLLLHAGMRSMWQRYPIAVACAYAAFLFFLWCWLRWRSKERPDLDDLPDIDSRSSSRHSEPVPEAADGGGLDLPDVSDGLGLDEGIVIVIAVAVVFAAFWALIWVIWMAPSLFAEILVDAALARGLYRRMRGVEDRHWLRTAIERTFWPFVATAVILSLAGALIQAYAPNAKSIGDLFRAA